MKWNTKISKFDDNGEFIRDNKLVDLIGEFRFSQMVFLLLRGDKGTDNENKMLESMLVSSIEHGLNPPSTINTRITASTTKDLSKSLIAGLSTFGEHHGGAVQTCAKLLMDNKNVESKEIVSNYLKNKNILPGFGHKRYETDPRTEKLVILAKELDLLGFNLKKSLEIEKELEKQKGKKLCLNIDGTIAAIALDLKFPLEVVNSLFIIPRMVGLTAHYYEEITEEKPYRRLSDEDLD